ncbi:hypothetical protein, partial [Paenibacillus odorifer]
VPLSMFSHVNTPPWTHYRQSVNYCPLFILASNSATGVRNLAQKAINVQIASSGSLSISG